MTVQIKATKVLCHCGLIILRKSQIFFSVIFISAILGESHSCFVLFVDVLLQSLC